jgi:hypothetical protein
MHEMNWGSLCGLGIAETLRAANWLSQNFSNKIRRRIVSVGNTRYDSGRTHAYHPNAPAYYEVSDSDETNSRTKSPSTSSIHVRNNHHV